MSTINVKDAAGTSTPVQLPPAPGQTDAANSVPVVLANEQQGTPITGAAMPTGGAGLYGWLSAIWKLLSGTLTVQGSVTVSDGSGPLTIDGTVVVSGTVPVSGPLTDTQLRASAVPVSIAAEVEVKNDSGNPLAVVEGGGAAAITGATMPAGGVGLTGWLSAIWKALTGVVTTRILQAPGVARQLTTTNTTADTALTVGIRSISIFARSSDARFSLGNGVQTASATSHFINSGERLDFDVSGFAAPHIAVIYGPSSAAATLEVTELS